MVTQKYFYLVPKLCCEQTEMVCVEFCVKLPHHQPQSEAGPDQQIRSLIFWRQTLTGQPGQRGLACREL